MTAMILTSQRSDTLRTQSRPVPGKAFLLSTVAGLALAVCLAQPAIAAPLAPPPVFHARDANGVDVTTGRLTVTTSALSIGPEQGGLTYQRIFESVTGDPDGQNTAESWNHNFVMVLDAAKAGTDGLIFVIINNESRPFSSSTSTPTTILNSAIGDGSTLERRYIAATTSYIWEYIASDGTKLTFDELLPGEHAGHPGYMMSKMERPDGVQTTLEYSFHNLRTPDSPNTDRAARVNNITTNAAYQLHFEYNSPTESGSELSWSEIKKVTALNTFYAYCAPVNPCNPGPMADGNPWPSLTYSYTDSIFVGGVNYRVTSVSRPLGGKNNETTEYYFHRDSGTSSIRPKRLGGVIYPEHAGTYVFDTKYIYGDAETAALGLRPQGYLIGIETRVTPTDSAATGTKSTSLTEYLYESSTGLTYVDEWFGDATANNKTRSIYSLGSKAGLLNGVQNGAGQATYFTHDDKGRITQISYPEGNSVKYAYQSPTRDNIVTVTHVPKPGFDFSNTTVTATFAADCNSSNRATCNRPLTVTDELGKTTTYEYYTAHGGIKSITEPADFKGRVPVTQFFYQPIYSYAGEYTPPGPPIVKLTSIQSCRTASFCAGSANQLVTEFTYAPAYTKDTRNLLPITETVRSGDNSVTLASTTTWTETGEAAVIDGPLGMLEGLPTENADQIRMFYDARRRLIGMQGPPATGVATDNRRSMRRTYNKNGQVTTEERGRVSSDNTSWTGFDASFVPLVRSLYTYDVGNRIAMVREGAGTVDASVMRYSYDRASRVICTALRMTLNTTNDNACKSVDSANPDRISWVSHDAAGRPWKTWEGFIPDAQGNPPTPTATLLYSPNGNLISRTDRRGVVMKWEYDGFDRLFRERFPNPSNGAVSSTTDYTQYAYDLKGNISSARSRDNRLTSYTVDNLGRIVGVSPNAESGYYMEYDLFDNPTLVYRNDRSITSEYDVLGRMLSSTISASTPKGSDDRFGKIRMRYDRGGRLTRLTWPDYFKDSAPIGQIDENDYFYVTYGSNLYGETTLITERPDVSQPGAVALASYGYNDLGQMSFVWRLNGAPTYFGYDSLYRLQSIVLDPAGSTGDQTWGFAWNPAGQIATRTSSEATYAPPAPPNSVPASYSNDSLDRYTSANGSAPDYDNRGNMTADGGSVTGTPRTYSYDLAGNLTEVKQNNVSVLTLAYDPLDRLMQTTAGPGGDTTLFLHAGDQLIGEMNAIGAVTRRYVPGPESEGPAVIYEHDGGGIPARRWPLYDDLGSVAAITDRQGRVLRINSYGTFGAPAAGNIGRFGFAGMPWLPEARLWHARARAYAPGLGRFLQPDPIGMAGGANLYAYTGNDPINATDTFGLAANDRNDCRPPACYRVPGEAPNPEPPNEQAPVFSGTYSFGLPTYYGMDSTTAYNEMITVVGSAARDGWNATTCFLGFQNSSSTLPDYNRRPRCRTGGHPANFGDIWVLGMTVVGPGKVGIIGPRVGAIHRGAHGASTRLGRPATNHNYGYAERILTRRDRNHSFPYSFDDIILENGSMAKSKGTYTEWHHQGAMNGRRGVFQIGVDNGMITHRVFVPF